VQGTDLAELQALKADPLVFAVMLGGVRSPMRSAEELADDVAFWGAHGFGMWTVRDVRTGVFRGLTGLMARPDGRGMALRFAFDPTMQGKGLAREAAGRVLRFVFDDVGLKRVVAVTRENNFGSRTVLGGIGMREREWFIRDGYQMLLYEATREPHIIPAS
jgi:RimJ/RimL family protein N-acetyltransferase